MVLALLEKVIAALVAAYLLLAVDGPSNFIFLTILVTPLLLPGLMYAVATAVER